MGTFEDLAKLPSTYMHDPKWDDPDIWGQRALSIDLDALIDLAAYLPQSGDGGDLCAVPVQPTTANTVKRNKLDVSQLGSLARATAGVPEPCSGESSATANSASAFSLADSSSSLTTKSSFASVAASPFPPVDTFDTLLQHGAFVSQKQAEQAREITSYATAGRLGSIPLALRPEKIAKHIDAPQQLRISVAPSLQVAPLKQAARKRAPAAPARTKKETIQDLERRIAEQQRTLQDLESVNDALKLQAQMYELIICERERRIQLLTDNGPPARTWKPVVGAGAVSNMPLTMLYASAEQAKEFSAQQLAARWKCFVQQASTLLLAVDGQGGLNDARGKELSDLCSVMCSTAVHVACLNTPCIAQISCINLDTGATEVPDSTFWQQVIRSISLTEQQVRQICTLLEICTKPLAALVPEFERLARQLQSTMKDDLELLEMSAAEQVQHAEVDVALKDLQGNLERQHMYYCQMAVCFYMLLTERQMALCAIHSYPYFPCVMSIGAELHKTVSPGSRIHLLLCY